MLPGFLLLYFLECMGLMKKYQNTFAPTGKSTIALNGWFIYYINRSL